jgi:glycosyltransferase involved in cell wall biosynthesis
MAAGNAIVSFNQSATILQHLETAFLVDSATAGDFAKGIFTVLDDPTLARQLRANVKSFVMGRFDWPTIAAKLEGIYGSLIPKSLAGAGRIDSNKPNISVQSKREARVD